MDTPVRVLALGAALVLASVATLWSVIKVAHVRSEGRSRLGQLRLFDVYGRSGPTSWLLLWIVLAAVMVPAALLVVFELIPLWIYLGISIGAVAAAGTVARVWYLTHMPTRNE
ncbi:hypothetical protein [Nocardia sp. IFM 10818]